jgi:hypothetical protein
MDFSLQTAPLIKLRLFRLSSMSAVEGSAVALVFALTPLPKTLKAKSKRPLDTCFELQTLAPSPVFEPSDRSSNGIFLTVATVFQRTFRDASTPRAMV